MKKYLRIAVFALIGATYGALGVLLSGLLFRNLGVIAEWIMHLLKLEADITRQVSDALSQLRDARLVSPYFLFIPACALLSALIFSVSRRAKIIIINAGVWLLLLAPVTLAAAAFTHVNDILFLDMIRLMTSIAPNL